MPGSTMMGGKGGGGGGGFTSLKFCLLACNGDHQSAAVGTPLCHVAAQFSCSGSLLLRLDCRFCPFHPLGCPWLLHSWVSWAAAGGGGAGLSVCSCHTAVPHLHPCHRFSYNRCHPLGLQCCFCPLCCERRWQTASAARLSAPPCLPARCGTPTFRCLGVRISGVGVLTLTRESFFVSCDF